MLPVKTVELLQGIKDKERSAKDNATKGGGSRKENCFKTMDDMRAQMELAKTSSIGEAVQVISPV